MLRVIEDTQLANIGDALRETLGEDNHFPVDDMDDAVRVAVQESSISGFEEGKKEGYANGKAEGIAEGYTTGKAEGTEEGKKAEQRAFWETFQQGGNRTHHMYTFYSDTFTDETYNPIYPIKIRTNNTNAFYQCGATDSKVVIDIGAYDLNNTFRYAKFVTMKIKIVEGANVKTAFTNMSALKNLEVTGTIGKSFDISDSPLTAASLKSLITALKDFTGGSEYSTTLTVNSSAFSKLESEGATAEYNGTACTWAELVGFKKWNLTKA